MDQFREEILAALAERAVASPSDAQSWCRVCRSCASSFSNFGLWDRVLAQVHWPFSNRLSSSVLNAFSKYGSHCSSLSVDGHRGGIQDLSTLAGLCPQISELEVTGIGVEGLDASALRHWAPSLHRMTLCFFYDAIDGAPALREVLQHVVETCFAVEYLSVHGIDWPSARDCVCEVLSKPGIGAPNLQKLEVTGSEAQLSPTWCSKFEQARPGLVVRFATRPAANLDW